MPLERKILLSIFFTLLLFFGSYLIYSNFYITYQDNINKIKKYERLISGFNSEEVEITEKDILELTNKIDKYENYFFKENKLDLSRLTLYIKEKLIKSNLSISQYRATDNSVIFSVSGTTDSIVKFFYNLSLEQRAYEYSMVNIKMINNSAFSGSLEIKEVVFSDSFELKNEDAELKKETTYRDFNTTIKSVFGLSFTPDFVKKEIPVLKKPEVKTVRTDKFSYIGKIKKADKNIVMFKDQVTGRIYRFSEGLNISGWTYKERRDNSFILEKDDVLYEVRE